MNRVRLTPGRIVAGLGGLIFFAGAVLTAGAAVVIAVMVAQGDRPSPWVPVGTCVPMLIGWALVRLTGRTLRRVLPIVTNV
ncbi:hypothetical protein EHW97_06070 [Aeromicrobium camelliae]|uniref:Uncharacterized protein n=1 Tax=Aeromicrobium camelliae TaxID=1538144 RepID=A0A3N6X474_9ACTN|nr:hypothetical protein [Aeromicrobium camelliae]RQN08453.1 hypothetical protein EHW97_06070 [Aeromicrobium camelliae]